MANSIKNKEPWFNYAIREFSLKLLDFYDSLNSQEKSAFKNKIKNQIKK